MITKIPYKDVPYICQDSLKVVLTALFVEVEDKRLISLIDPTTIENRVAIVRESEVFDNLISALDIFGIEDFVKIITPKLITFTEDLSLGRDFKATLENNFKEIL